LTKKLSNSFVGDRLARRHQASFSPMQPQTRDKLLETFAEPTRELEQLLGRPLPDWFT
jgi:hypothetical protein